MIKKYSEFKIFESLENPYNYENISLSIIDLLTSSDELNQQLGLQQEEVQNIDLSLFWEDVYLLNRDLKGTPNSKSKIKALSIFREPTYYINDFKNSSKLLNKNLN